MYINASTYEIFNKSITIVYGILLAYSHYDERHYKSRIMTSDIKSCIQVTLVSYYDEWH